MSPRPKLEVIFNRPKVNIGYNKPKFDVSTGIPIIRDQEESYDYVFTLTESPDGECLIPQEPYEEVKAGVLRALDHNAKVYINTGEYVQVLAKFDYYGEADPRFGPVHVGGKLFQEAIVYTTIQASSGDYSVEIVVYGLEFQTLEETYASEETIAYYTGGALAKASDVRKYKDFFGSDGRMNGSVPTRASSNVSVSGNTVSFPSGIYDENVSVSLPLYSGSQNVQLLDTTQTLATDGKFVNGNITFAPWDWRGVGAEQVSVVYPKTTVALKDTTFPSWTASTTASAIVAATSLTAVTIDLANYEYLIKWEYLFQAEYNSGVTKKNIVYRTSAELWQLILKRANTVAEISSSSNSANACITLFSAPLTVYYGSTTNTLTYTHAISYGIYPAVQTATFSSGTSNSPKLTIKTPAINARCNSSVMATARAGELDQDNSKYTLKGTLYRVNKGAMARLLFEDCYGIYNNGIS